MEWPLYLLSAVGKPRCGFYQKDLSGNCERESYSMERAFP
jgi:hypothetical protein